MKRRGNTRYQWATSVPVSVLLALLCPPPGGTRSAHAATESPRALFALIVGVNTSPDANIAALQYADDDAARYLDLFRSLGARTTLLSRLDASTRRLHPQAAAEAVPPRRAELRQAVDVLARDIAQARARGVKSTLYVLYAGHGDVEEAGWYLTLEDARLTGADLLSEVVERAGADQSHVIIDACHSYLLALPRGPGGTRRPLEGFVELEAASRAGHVGYLLSSSMSGESHEWSGFEAGVFSHEVRSGLYGAADADGDGQVTYAEIGAFVSRANQTIANDRFRPRVLARAPRDGDLLLDLRSRRDRGLRFDGPEADAHYLLENANGIRLLDFHGDGRTPVQLIRPPGEGALYLRRVSDGAERTIPRVDGVVQLDELPITPARSGSRGAAHHAFGQIFAMSFDGNAVRTWTRDTADAQARLEASDLSRDTATRRARARRIGGIVALSVGAVAAIAATAFERSAHVVHDDAPANENHRDTVTRNERINLRNHAAIGLTIGAAAAGVAAAALLLWPNHPPAVPEIDMAVSTNGGTVGAQWHF